MIHQGHKRPASKHQQTDDQRLDVVLIRGAEHICHHRAVHDAVIGEHRHKHNPRGMTFEAQRLSEGAYAKIAELVLAKMRRCKGGIDVNSSTSEPPAPPCVDRVSHSSRKSFTMAATTPCSLVSCNGISVREGTAAQDHTVEPVPCRYFSSNQERSWRLASAFPVVHEGERR